MSSDSNKISFGSHIARQIATFLYFHCILWPRSQFEQMMRLSVSRLNGGDHQVF
jgi:hypothetical protein